MDTSFETRLGTFLDRISTANELPQIRKVFDLTVSEMGIKYFTYHVVKIAGVGDHLPHFVTTYPDSWVEHYIDRNYVHVDPLISEGPKRMVPFLWDEVARPDLLDRKQRALYGEAAGLGIAGGLSIPIHGRNGEFAMMSVAPDRELGAAGLAALRHQIHLLSMYYHNCTGSIILEQLMKTPRQKDVLTDREKECLRWSAIGKSAADIAGILNISRTTVIYYIENAKRKLDVFSTTHAVVKAMALHLITLD